MNNRKKILIVEDDPPSALVLSQMLNKEGYFLFDPVDRGEDAIQASFDLSPDLILMDITLKGDVDGITAALKIREKRSIPVVYITVSRDEETIRRAKESLPSGYLFKPYDKHAVCAAIEMALYRSDSDRLLRETGDRDRSMIEKAPDIMFMIGMDGGFPSGEDERTAGPVWSERVQEKAWPSVRAAMEGRTMSVFEYALARRGRTAYYEARITPAGADRALVVVRDVTARKADDDSTRRARKVLESRLRSLNEELASTRASLEREAEIRVEMERRIAMQEARDSLERSSRMTGKSEAEWNEWKDRMKERNMSRTDKSLFKNIHGSFTRGAGFGALIGLIDTMISDAEKEGERRIVDGRLVDMIQNNVNIIKDAFKTFSSIDWIITNEFQLQKTSLSELYENVKAVISRVEEYAGINNNRIIINEFNGRFGKLSVNLNKDYFTRAVYEVLINALKFSRKNTFVIVFVNVEGRDALLSVINEPEKGGAGIVGIPVEYEKVVFEPFFRLAERAHEEYNTLEFGLGLTLVEKIIARHGGVVEARNIIDHSDTRRESQVKVSLSVRLPLAEG
ncbi:MAG: response regulator [Spirochaetes bacterium]|nr:response regulator [Spirochaetota bacterium]